MSKNVRKVLILICILLIFVLLYKAIQIYAVFQSQKTGNINFKNGTWYIEVNGTEISNGVTTDFVINQMEIQGDVHVKPGNLAPGLIGKFDIAIVPTNTEVSVRYDITFGENENTIDAFSMKSVQEIVENNTLVKTDVNTYSAIIPLEKIANGTYNTIAVEVEWIDDGTNDEQDTQMGAQDDIKIEIPITVHVCQYLGEELIPYTE